MPTVDESQQDRQTFGSAPGWKDTPTETPPTAKPPEGSGAVAAPPAVEESSAQPEVSEQATPPSSQPPEEPTYHVPPKERWDELVAQRKEAERQRDEAVALAQQAIQRSQPPPSQPQADPWEQYLNHPDPAEAQRWRVLRDLVRHDREAAKQEAVRELAPIIEAGRTELARLNLQQFRKDNPDIKPGSEEERLIVAYMGGKMDGVQHPLESAKRNALFDRLESENRALKSKHASTPQKVAAARTEASAGIPEQSGLPGRPQSWEERAGEVIDKGGSILDVAKATFK